MISVLIPIYNFDVSQLAKDLNNQLIKSGKTFEIILMDDCSEETYRITNSSLTKIEQLSYIQLDENIGRSRIRNKLASTAQFERILFLDCDSMITAGFVDNYLQEVDKAVVCGGTLYYDEKPHPSQMLRWKYGKKREELSAVERTGNPYFSFKTNNFLLDKSIFNQLQFDEKIRSYGHEDTLFALGLEQLGIGIKHIDNPVYHVGLDSNREFLKKTELALQALHYMINDEETAKLFQDNFRLVSAYRRFRRPMIRQLILAIYYLKRPFLKVNLRSGNPSLLAYDIYKLGYLLNLG